MGNIAPLNASFMMTSIIGFLVSVIYIYSYSVTWAFTFAFVFVLMFIASLISMVRGDDMELQLYARPRQGGFYMEKILKNNINKSEFSNLQIQEMYLLNNSLGGI